MRGVALPYLGARARGCRPGDVMADGVNPGVCSRLLVLSGSAAPRSDDRSMAGASRGHQWKWAEARTGHGSGSLPGRESGRSPGVVAQGAQGVVAAAGELAGDGEGGALPAETIPHGHVVVVVGRASP